MVSHNNIQDLSFWIKSHTICRLTAKINEAEKNVPSDKWAQRRLREEKFDMTLMRDSSSVSIISPVKMSPR